VLGSNLIDTLDGKMCRTIVQGIERFKGNRKGLGIECSMGEILKADFIMVVEGDPEKTNPIVGNFIRRAIKHGDAKLVVIDPYSTIFPLRTDLWLKPKAGTEKYLLNGLIKNIVDRGLVAAGKAGTVFIQELDQYQIDEVVKVTGVEKERLEKVAEIYGTAEHGVIIYGEGLLQRNEPELVTSLLTLADITGNKVGDRLRVISLKPNANSWGAWELGLAKGIESKTIKGLYLLLGDDNINNINDELLSWLKGIGALIVQASYQSPVTAIADLVLPSPIWAERGGTYVNMDGHILKSKQILQTGEGLLQDKEILVKLARELGHKLS
jgi:predicted molibdopterin-dependent oxidoreductase YjgC